MGARLTSWRQRKARAYAYRFASWFGRRVYGRLHRFAWRRLTNVEKAARDRREDPWDDA